MVYLGIWALNYFLIRMRLTENIEKGHSEAYFIIYITISFALICSLATIISQKKLRTLFVKLNKSIPRHRKKVKFWLNVIPILWLSISTINIIYINGFPLINILLGHYSNYAAKGIPSIKGLGDTLYLLSGTLFVVNAKYYQEKFPFKKALLIYIFIYPILMMSRALIITLLLQIIFIKLFDAKLKLTSLLKVFVFIFLVIIVFGLIGDSRGEHINPFASMISENGAVLHELPSGFTWIYIYITANFNNILLTLGSFTPNGSFQEIFYNLVPGALKPFFFDGSTTDFSPVLQDENLNVASMYVGYVSGFGIFGAIMGGLIYLTICTIFHIKLLIKPNIGNLMLNSVIFQTIILGIFYDSFLTVSTMFQLFFCMYLGREKRAQKHFKHKNSL